MRKVITNLPLSGQTRSSDTYKHVESSVQTYKNISLAVVVIAMEWISEITTRSSVASIPKVDIITSSMVS
jgi:hypothetical protein